MTEAHLAEFLLEWQLYWNKIGHKLCFHIRLWQLIPISHINELCIHKYTQIPITYLHALEIAYTKYHIQQFNVHSCNWFSVVKIIPIRTLLCDMSFVYVLSIWIPVYWEIRMFVLMNICVLFSFFLIFVSSYFSWCFMKSNILHIQYLPYMKVSFSRTIK